jgi:hypothetical protein
MQWMLDYVRHMTATHLVVDGSNIATEGRTLPSLAQLDEAVRAFIAERPHDIYTVVVDATFEHRIDASERRLYDEALANNELIVTPAGTVGRGDRFILEVADRAGATVLSNDSFQEFHGDYKWLFDSGRLIGGRPVPGVGWIFVERTPVRGPKSRMATRQASRKRGGTPSKAASEPMPTPSSPPPAKRRSRSKATAEKAPANKAPANKAPAREPKAREPKADAKATEPKARPARASRPQQPLNDQLPFITFIADHLPGSTVEGEVVEFSSHGAYVQVGDVRCYVPLKNMGSPAPRSAREVLERGEKRSFVVQSIEAARRGIDLALPGFGEVASVPAPAAAPAKRSRSRSAPAAAVDKALPVAASEDAAPAVDKAPAEAGAKQPQSEATLAATKKAAGRKTAAKKTTARKATAKKATAKKTARKAPAKRSTAKKATARKATAKKAGARKSTAKKATARKSTAKKAGARKSTAKKAGARKSTAKKAGARKSTAKKAGARKSTAKKAGARKRVAKKAGARKSTAKKAGARKRVAKKAGARKRVAKKR